MEDRRNLKGLPINFFEVYVFNPRDSILTKLPVRFSKLLLHGCHYMSEHLGIPISSHEHQLLSFRNILQRAWSMPRGSHEMFVCIVNPDTNSVQQEDTQENAESGFSMEFKVVTGVHVNEEEAVSWDLADDKDVNHVLRVCKPPILCLRKMKVGPGSGLHKEEVTCPVCFGEFPVGSEAVRTHLFSCLPWSMYGSLAS